MVSLFTITSFTIGSERIPAFAKYIVFRQHEPMILRTLLHQIRKFRIFLLTQSATRPVHCVPAIKVVGKYLTMILLALGHWTTAQAEEVPRGPDVVIIAGKDKVIYEYRQNGELRIVRIVPKWGKPYYLVPRDNTRGHGNLERADMLLPQWVIAEF